MSLVGRWCHGWRGEGEIGNTCRDMRICSASAVLILLVIGGWGSSGVGMLMPLWMDGRERMDVAISEEILGFAHSLQV